MEFKYYLALILIISFITMILYFSDKRRAMKNKWRIKESVLLSFSFFGGALGGMVGLYVLRHKTKHWYFVVINWLGLIIQVALGLYLLTK